MTDNKPDLSPTPPAQDPDRIWKLLWMITPGTSILSIVYAANQLQFDPDYHLERHETIALFRDAAIIIATGLLTN